MFRLDCSTYLGMNVVRLFFIFFVLFSQLVAAQEDASQFDKPDYANIEKITKDKAFQSYYPKLYKRYQSFDTTLTERDFYLLYYGYFFQDEYASFHSSPYRDSIDILFKKDKHTDVDKKNAIRYTLADMANQPYNLRNLNMLCELYKSINQFDTAELYFFRIRHLAAVIFSTGDGRTEATAMHVLQVNDEYSILDMLGFEFAGSQSVTQQQCDYLKVLKNEDRVDGFYFDVSQIFKGYTKSMGLKNSKRKTNKK